MDFGDSPTFTSLLRQEKQAAVDLLFKSDNIMY